MKKRYLIFAMLLCVVFATGCQAADDGSADGIEGMQSSSQESNVEFSEDTTEPSVQADDSPDSVMEAFQSVLLNEAAFSYTDKIPYDNTNVIQQLNGFLSERPYGYDNYDGNIYRFAIVDMDGDSIPEVVLELEDYVGFLILRYADGQVKGNFLGYRSMSSIKENGSFQSEASAFEGWWQKLYFVEDTVVMDWNAYFLESIDSELYRIDDITVEKNDYEDVAACFNESAEVEWHDYTEEAVRESFGSELSLTESAWEKSKERQAYLDSLSYLLNLTYDYTRKTEEEFHADAKSYYDGCFEELNKIYQLCTEKLTGETLEAITTEQQRWEEENGVEPEDDVLYYEYGDKALRRTLRLLNIYYGYTYIIGYDWVDLGSGAGEATAIQVLMPEDVAVAPEIKEYDYESAREAGDVVKLRGMLPGASEGTWYMIEIDGIEYYYAEYDASPDNIELLSYAIVGEEYSLSNGISVGMTKEEVLAICPDMAMLDTEGRTLNPVTGHMGWNSVTYPHSPTGMDEEWEYSSREGYSWDRQFDFIMIADIEQNADTLPLYLAVMMRNGKAAAITFYCPTAG